MNTIKCPECGTQFDLDDTNYAEILKQVRDHAFESEKSEAVKLALEAQAATIAASNAKALSEKDIKISELNSTININEEAHEKEIMQIEEQHKKELQLRDEEIERVKDFKAKQSTKMIGEDLEQYCLNEFNKIRTTAFPTCEFGKDNDASGGSKGDFIFRDFDNGTEYISIMFEMKNQADTTATKHKNEDFFEKLDKDRTSKNCEYAVLVSMLEEDSDYYNNGIVDVSYKYSKMYVIRPQFLIQLIGILKNAARETIDVKQKLQLALNQNIDITNFEDSLNDYKGKFLRNCNLAKEKFDKAIDEIDKTINSLQKIKESLLSSEDNLRLANNKLDDITIKKLTKGNPTMKARFEALESGAAE